MWCLLVLGVMFLNYVYFLKVIVYVENKLFDIGIFFYFLCILLYLIFFMFMFLKCNVFKSIVFVLVILYLK